jgi:hypothetical protein
MFIASAVGDRAPAYEKKSQLPLWALIFLAF